MNWLKAITQNGRLVALAVVVLGSVAGAAKIAEALAKGAPL